MTRLLRWLFPFWKRPQEEPQYSRGAPMQSVTIRLPADDIRKLDAVDNNRSRLIRKLIREFLEGRRRGAR